MSHNGFLITIDGIDGSGKSTLLKDLIIFMNCSIASWYGLKLIWTGLPAYYDEYGEEIRRKLKNGGFKNTAEALDLCTKNIVSHKKKCLDPLLKDKKSLIICDRYYFSTAAYQSSSLGEAAEVFESRKVYNFPKPDLALWIDIDVDTALKNIGKRDGESRDCYENIKKLNHCNSVYRMLHKQGHLHRVPFSDLKSDKYQVHLELTTLVINLMISKGSIK